MFNNLPLHPNSSLPSVQSSLPSHLILNGMQGEVLLQVPGWSQTHVPDVHLKFPKTLNSVEQSTVELK